MKDLERNQLIQSIIPYIIVIGGILLIVFLLLNAYKRKKEMELEAQRLQWMQEQAEREAANQSGLVDIVAGEEINLDDIMDEDKNSTLGQLQSLVEKNPQGIAQILRNWLMDDFRR